MPIHVGQDENGPFVQWGNRTKYYFNKQSVNSFNKAYDRAVRQMKAIYSRGYKQ